MTWLSRLLDDDASLALRPATVDDAELLADIVMAATEAQGRRPEMSAADEADWRKGFAGWSRQTVEQADPGNVLAVVVAGGQVVGRLRLVRGTGGEAFLRLAGIQLLPAWQRRGIGTTIIRGLQDAARREKVPLLLGVEKDNAGARRLYERLGFVHVGEDDEEHQLRWTSA
ncbi:GNAT family N-acetyltransferase [Paractinoplanes atraurantiacus]|uniref:Mycothiol synthase n=1 Tax=Paractinoplanes atraurantiacus TaxID=1036182 RepID=A0A285JL36_9ACTN|nr:GNAT family N-acetyltransferase [Actinoplanes atraurantiacus]SNY60985.1 mycothiol synthase [Actinoplanes atraurantiacus]